MQEKEGVVYHKVLGTENPADLMTKYLIRDVVDKHMSTLGQDVREGRAQKGLEMQGSQHVESHGDSVAVKVAAVFQCRPATYGQMCG